MHQKGREVIMAAKEVKITLRNAGKINPESINDYIKAGGTYGYGSGVLLYNGENNRLLNR